MYYQVMIEISDRSRKSGNRRLFELDKTNLAEIEADIITPFLKNEGFQFDGYFVNPHDVKRLVVKETDDSVKVYSQYENDHMPVGAVGYISPSDILSYDKHTRDITKEAMNSARKALSTAATSRSMPPKETTVNTTKVFVVHGRDDLAKVTVARFLEKLGLQAVILHEQASAGRTLIEKIEAYTDVGFAIVVYTPDDVGAEAATKPALKHRARQNVVFEHGYLIGKLGRSNVCALLKGDVEKPSDISGIVYVPFDDRGAWNTEVAKEMNHAGYTIDLNRLV
jgi:predicted nucleotide-binding protein